MSWKGFDKLNDELWGLGRHTKGYNKSPINVFIIFSLFGDFLEGRHTTLGKVTFLLNG